MEVVCSSEASMYFSRNTRRQNPEDRAVHSDRCENLKSNRDSFQFVYCLFIFLESYINSVKRVKETEIQK
jgi:hypothetical protein